MLCLKCNNEQLVEYSFGSGVYSCTTCSGNWLEYDPVNKYLTQRDEMVAKAFQNIWDGQSDASPNRKCPKDNISLYLFTFKGVELDFCMLCRGLWFDVFEMEGFNSVEDKENPKAIKPGTRNAYSLGGEMAAEVPLEGLF